MRFGKSIMALVADRGFRRNLGTGKPFHSLGIMITVGSLVRLEQFKSSDIVGSDWLNERPPVVGDIAIVEIVQTPESPFIRLRCGEDPYNFAWRIDIRASDITLAEL
jgi:hypothetical protein